MAGKGRPKTGGRGKGVPNVVTAEVKALAAAHAPEVIQELHRIALHGESEQARIAACRELLDRGCGKPTQQIDVSATAREEHREIRIIEIVGTIPGQIPGRPSEIEVGPVDGLPWERFSD